MSKEFFKNLPDTSTPLNASRLNGLLNGNEALGNIVVGDVKGKNLFNKNTTVNGYIATNSTEENLASSDAKTTEWISCKPNTYYTIQGGDRRRIQYKNSSGVITHSSYSKDNGDVLTFLTSSDTAFFRVYICSSSSSSNDSIQIEEGTIATEYTPYKGIGYTNGSNENGSWIKFDDGTLIQRGIKGKDEFISETGASTTTQGINWYRSGIPYINLPINFVDSNYIVSAIVKNGTAGSRLTTHRLHAQSVDNFQIQLIGLESFSENGVGFTNLTNIQWIAIGRWK